jgi:hypothetical protein
VKKKVKIEAKKIQNKTIFELYHGKKKAIATDKNITKIANINLKLNIFQNMYEVSFLFAEISFTVIA